MFMEDISRIEKDEIIQLKNIVGANWRRCNYSLFI